MISFWKHTILFRNKFLITSNLAFYKFNLQLIGAGKNGVEQVLSQTIDNTVNANLPAFDMYYGSALYYATTNMKDYNKIATDNAVNANLPAMDKYGPPLFYGTANMNDDSNIAFYSGLNPETPQLDPFNEYSMAFYKGLNPENLQIDQSNDYSTALYSGQNLEDPHSTTFCSGLNQDNPQLDPLSALLGNHQLCECYPLYMYVETFFFKKK